MLLAYGFLKMFIIAAIIKCTFQACYTLKMLTFRTTETSEYLFSMKMHDNQTLSSLTRVLEEVKMPMWNLVLVQYNAPRKNVKQDPSKILYNSTYKACELWSYVKRIRAFNNVVQLLFNENSGNMSFKCPLKVGTYLMRNVHIPPDTGLLKFMYSPKTIYTLYGTVYSLKPNDVYEKKCSYEINATVFKSC